MTVTLCIPAYNAAAFLPRLLESAARQTIPFDEIIVCDDASIDETAAIARTHGAKVIVNENNRGCAVSKNRALQEASAKWIHFHDADDELLPNFTTLAHRWASSVDAPDLVLFDYEYRDEGTHELIDQSNFDDAELRKDALRYAILHKINPFCGLYRRDRLIAVGGWDEDPEVLYNEDVASHCKLALAGFAFRAEKELSVINYRRVGSMSAANRTKCARAQFHVMRKVVTQLANENRLTAYEEPIATRLWEIATFAASCCDWAYVDRCIDLAEDLGIRQPTQESTRFRLLTKLSPRAAFRLRERLIRIFRPALRAGYPTV